MNETQDIIDVLRGEKSVQLAMDTESIVWTGIAVFLSTALAMLLVHYITK